MPISLDLVCRCMSKDLCQGVGKVEYTAEGTAPGKGKRDVRESNVLTTMASTSFALSVISFHNRRSSSASWLGLTRPLLRPDMLCLCMLTRRNQHERVLHERFGSC